MPDGLTRRPNPVVRHLRRIGRRLARNELLFTSRYYFDYLFARGRSRGPYLHVTLDLTYRCNFRCNMCFLYGEHLDDDNPTLQAITRRRELTLEQWQGVLDQLWSVGNRALVITGGEVFLRKDFLDLLRYAKGKGFQVSVLTNGSLITADNVGELVSLEPDFLRFSLDGDRATHDGICRTPSFDRLMRSIDLIQSEKKGRGARRPRLGFETVIQRHNQDRLHRIVEIARDKGVADLIMSNIFFIPDQTCRDPREAEEIRSRGQRTRDVIQRLYDVDVRTVDAELTRCRETAKRHGIRLDCRLHGPDDVANIYGDPTFSFLNKCFYPWLMARINPYGEVIPCTGSSLVMGNLQEQSFSEIWNGERFVRFRKQLKREGLFPECAKCNTLAADRWQVWDRLPRVP